MWGAAAALVSVAVVLQRVSDAFQSGPHTSECFQIIVGTMRLCQATKTHSATAVAASGLFKRRLR